MSSPRTPTSLTHRRVIIVGAGQAGLAVAAALISEGLTPQKDFVVVDRGTGERTWASRWHSLQLLSDARHSALPSHPLRGDQRRYPRGDEIVEYLDDLQARLGVIPALGVEATGVEHPGSGSTLLLATSRGAVQTRNVVCATGAAARPNLPGWVAELIAPGVVLHSSQYQYPKQVPPGEVLIVGGGNGGAHLARELALTHTVTWSVRDHRAHAASSTYPARAGTRTTRLRRRTRPEPLFTDTYDSLARAGVCIIRAVASASGETVTLVDGTQLQPQSVILATGYLPGDDWLPAHARDTRASRTQTPIPGLFVSGIPRYSSRGADTLAGVWRDATTIAHHITTRP